jgi:hypothetical protein
MKKMYNQFILEIVEKDNYKVSTTLKCYVISK